VPTQTTLAEANQALSTWLSQNASEVAAQKGALDAYGKLFRPENIANIAEEDFRAFLLFKNNKHWSGIHRHPNIYADMPRLKSALGLLVDESIPVDERLDRITDASGSFYIKGLGRAVLTPILMCVYKDKYAVYNRISEEALTLLGRNVIKPNDSFGHRYVSLNDSCLQIASEISQPLWLVDTMFSLLVHGPVSSPVDSVDTEELLDVDTDADTLASPAIKAPSLTFPLEKYLEEFLISNWDNTVFGDTLSLHSEDDEDATQYSMAVGRIDILARDKSNGDWVVIELKKGKHADSVVGQVLRYMGWVKKHKAKDGQQVRGIIITGAPDDKIKYAMLATQNISFYTYRVNFELTLEQFA